jgi:hypothetical protein
VLQERESEATRTAVPCAARNESVCMENCRISVLSTATAAASATILHQWLLLYRFFDTTDAVQEAAMLPPIIFIHQMVSH